MYHKLLPIGVGLLAALFLAVAVAVAAPDVTVLSAQGSAPTAGAALTNTITSTLPVTGQLKIALAVAKTFSTTVAQVMAIRAQGLGWGEVYKVFLLAQLTGQSPTAIVNTRQSGQGWGEIFKAAGQNPGQGKNNLGQSIKASQQPTTTVTTSVTPKSNKGNGNGQDDQNDDKGQNQPNKGNPNSVNPNRGNPNNPPSNTGKPNDKGKGK